MTDLSLIAPSNSDDIIANAKNWIAHGTPEVPLFQHNLCDLRSPMTKDCGYYWIKYSHKQYVKII